MKSIFETKATGNSIKDVDVPQGIVCGYLSAFGNEDTDGDVVEKGAFSKTLNEGIARVKHLQDHDTRKTVGRFLVLKQDSHGLYFESKIGSHTLGVDYLKMCQDGIVTEHSIGYRVVQEVKQKNGPRLLKELRLFEGSGLSAWGSNPRTPITAIKSYQDVSDRLEIFTKAFHDADYSDDSFQLMEIEIKILQQQLLNATQAERSPEPDEIALKELHKLNNYFKNIQSGRRN